MRKSRGTEREGSLTTLPAMLSHIHDQCAVLALLPSKNRSLYNRSRDSWTVAPLAETLGDWSWAMSQLEFSHAELKLSPDFQ
jgi:hypothetical protein